MKIRQLCLCFGLLLWQSVYGQVQLSPANFSHIAQITPSNSTAVVVDAVLPQWVYLNTQQQLADLRVFNQDGIAVAHQLSLVDSYQQGSEITLNAIPVRLLNRESKLAEGSPSADFHLDAQGNIAIHVNGKVTSSSIDDRVSQWVMDARAISNSVTGFRFMLNSETENFSADVAIESSDDLRYWQTVSSAQKLLLLQNADNRLAQLAISIPSQKAKYWRIKAVDSDDLTRIQKINLQTVGSTSNQYEKLTIQCQIANNGKTVLCPLPSALPVNQVQVNFNQAGVAFNGLVSTYTKDAKKYAADSVLLTMLSNAQNNVNLNGIAIRSIELTAQNDDVLGLKIAPSVTVQWPAQQLRFLAHGSAPFMLAVGNAKLLDSGQQQVADNLPTTKASIGDPILQNAAAIVKNVEPAKAKPWLLWGILAVAVFLLSGMAWKLLKD